MGDERRSRSGCLWFIIGLQTVALFVLCIVVLGLAAVGVGGTGFVDEDREYGVDEYPELEEVWSAGSGDTKIVRIAVRGPIFLVEGGGLFSSQAGSAMSALRSIRRATLDEDVHAIILDIDSGGGGVTASDMIYRALLDFKAAGKNRKVVAVFGDVAASGAYYLAMAADHIVARPTSITGSIGVLMQSLNVKELAQKIGIKDVTIKSAENKDLLNPFRDMTEEQRQLLQSIIDDMYSRFVGIVAEGRGLPDEEVRLLADGKVFTAGQALEHELIDEVGYWDDAVTRTAELLRVSDVKVYRYEQAFSLSALLRAWTHFPDIRQALQAAPRLQYRWVP